MVGVINGFVNRQIARRPALRGFLENTGWLFFDKIIRLGVGLVVGVWLARYLGPEQFGILSYVTTIVALFGALSGLGLYGIVVRDLVRKPDGTDITLGTTFFLQLVGGLAACLLIIISVVILRPSDELARVLAAVLSFTLVFKATDVVKYWFESQGKLKYVVWVESSIFLTLALVRVFLIVTGASIIVFAWLILLEGFLAGVALLLIYTEKSKRLFKWRVKLSRAKILLMESWPLVFGAAASMINMRMDQIMLGTMVNDSVVGNYSAAVRLAEIWLMIPAVIGPAIYPSIIAAKEVGEDLYRRRILQVIKLMAICILPFAVIISLMSDYIVLLIYGQQYTSAGGYLAIYIWAGVPYMIFFVLNQMLHIEGMLKIGFVVGVFTVLINIPLNLILIPRFEGAGAAFSTLITAFFSIAIYLVLLNSKTRVFFSR